MKLKTALMGAVALSAAASTAYAERGTDGQLNILYWQAPAILNPYLSSGTKDVNAASVVLEPLASFDTSGAITPRLAAELPTLENGGISADFMSVTWKLKPGLTFSDGSPVTSADVVFSGQYCMDPAGGCAQASRFEGIEKLEAVDDLTVKITFKEAKLNPLIAFVGATTPILSSKQFANCMGANAPTCTEANTMPLGTGAFKVTAFKPDDSVQYEANPNYRDAAKPAFANINLKGGGDATAAARAVLETGEFDYAWNLQVAPDVLNPMEAAGKGKILSGYGTSVERIEINTTDPSSDLPEGERSTSKHPHPIFSDINVRKALSMAIDRSVVDEVGYGAAGQPTCDLVAAPPAYVDPANTGCLKQDMEGAKALLDAAGWKDSDGDGIRDKDGKKFHVLYQTSINPVRQDVQALVKEWWTELGVEVELKSIDAGVFFGGDAGSPDTFQKFYADVEMYTNNFDGTDPEAYMNQYLCNKAPSPENQWQGENMNRYCDPAYDALAAEMGKTSDMAKRAELVKKMNAMLTSETFTVIPLIHRGEVSGMSNTLGGVNFNVWDSQLADVADWFRVK